MSQKPKEYGLIMPRKAKNTTLQSCHSAFQSDSDSEEVERKEDWMEKTLKNSNVKPVKRKQVRLEMQRALAEDPTVYQYDEIYDKMEEKKQDINKKKEGERKKPCYIQALLKSAEMRKQEMERRMERKVQKEREMEGEMYADKEAFVTSAYKKKMEELQAQEEQERKNDELEAVLDVKKQKDLGGFYRHLYKVKLGEIKPFLQQKEELEHDKDVKNEESEMERRKGKIGEKERGSAGGSEGNKCVSDKETIKQVKNTGKERHYRRRETSSSESEPEGRSSPKMLKNTDSDFSENSSSNSEDDQKNRKKLKARHDRRLSETDAMEDDSHSSTELKRMKEKTQQRKQRPVSTFPENRRAKFTKDASQFSPSSKQDKRGRQEKEDITNDSLERKKDADFSENENDKTAVNGDVTQSSVWKKRTVGQVFEAARERYMARKFVRESVKSGVQG